MQDKRRYVSRDPHRVRKLVSIADDETGNAAKDGYTVLSRKPLARSEYINGNYGNETYDRSGDRLIDEHEARMRIMFGDD